MESYPCPNCDEVFDTVDDLTNHALHKHTLQQLSKVIGEHMSKTVTRDDFIQADSHWIYVYRNSLLSLAPDKEGKFKLTIVTSFEDIPAATQYPTEPEWSTAERVTNKYIAAFDHALEQDKRN